MLSLTFSGLLLKGRRTRTRLRSGLSSDGPTAGSKSESYLLWTSADDRDGAAFKETPDRIRLTRFTYDPIGPSPVQTFPVVPEIIKMGILVSDVVFAFNSNWGGNLTCIYRVSHMPPRSVVVVLFGELHQSGSLERRRWSATSRAGLRRASTPLP